VDEQGEVWHGDGRTFSYRYGRGPEKKSMTFYFLLVSDAFTNFWASLYEKGGFL